MRIALLSIGSELLKGQTLNTNATFLSRELTEAGYTCTIATTVHDSPQEIKEGIAYALSQADIVIGTGGLGPTLDDLTESVAKELFSGGEKTLPNTIGTASGLLFQEKDKWLILLPGVPQEMQPMFFAEVLPLLKKTFPAKVTQKHTLRFCLLSENMVDPLLRDLQKKHPQLSIGIYPSYEGLSLSVSGDTGIPAFTKEVLDKFGTYYYPKQTLVESLIAICREKRVKLAFAESCTGGHLASMMTSTPGASDIFLGSVVAYSNSMKQALLDVKKQTLLERGAVSPETVLEMLEGLFEYTDADFGVALSGIAGPSGATATKNIGTVYVALGEKNKRGKVEELHLPGDRAKVIALSCHFALSSLFRHFAYGAPFSSWPTSSGSRIFSKPS